MATSSTPIEDAMRKKVANLGRLPQISKHFYPVQEADLPKMNDTLAPTALEIFNDSHKHAHHKAMEGSTSKETHFRVHITSEAFKTKGQPARHRMIYTLLKDEMSTEGGIHALQLRTRTPDEDQKAKAKEATI